MRYIRSHQSIIVKAAIKMIVIFHVHHYCCHRSASKRLVEPRIKPENAVKLPINLTAIVATLSLFIQQIVQKYNFSVKFKYPEK